MATQTALRAQPNVERPYETVLPAGMEPWNRDHADCWVGPDARHAHPSEAADELIDMERDVERASCTDALDVAFTVEA